MINQSNLSKNLYDNQSKLTIVMIKLIGLNTQCNNMFTKYGNIKFNEVFICNEKASFSNEDFNKKLDFLNEIDYEKPEIYRKRTRIHIKEEKEGKSYERLKNKVKNSEKNTETVIKTRNEHIKSKSKSQSKTEQTSKSKSHSNIKKINTKLKNNRNFDRILEYDRTVRKNFMPKTPTKTNNNVFIYIPNLTLVDNSHISHISKGKYKDRSNSNLSRNSILNNQKSIVSSISELGITKNSTFQNINNINTYNNSSYVKLYEQKQRQKNNLINNKNIINNNNNELKEEKRILNRTPSPSPSPSPTPTQSQSQSQFKKKEKIKINQFKKENTNKTSSYINNNNNNNNNNTLYEKDYSNEEEYYNENRMTFNPNVNSIGQTYSKKKVNLPIDLKKINDECECTEEESQTYSFKDETESDKSDLKSSQNQFIFQKKKGFK